MKQINATIKDQTLTIEQSVINVAGSVNAYALDINYDAEWDDMDTKIVTFTHGPIRLGIQDDGSEDGIVIPHEVLTFPGVVTVGVVGYKGSEAKLTTTGLYKRNTFVVLPQALGLADALTPTPDIYVKLVNKLEELQGDYDNLSDEMGSLSDLETQNKDSLVAAINEVLNSGGGSGTVKSVNNVQPDANGNVALTAGDVGATTTAYVTEAVAAEAEIRQGADAALHQEIGAKQDTLTTAQLDAVNSGITSTKVENYDNYAIDIQDLQVGKQDKLTVGANIQISSENEISATDTTYNDFTGTDGVDPGTAGLVPAPATTDAGKFLKADGTWDTAGGGGVTPVQTTGTSTTDVMSQDATTKLVYPQIEDYPKGIGIGNEVTTNNSCISIGEYIDGGVSNAILIGQRLQGYASGIAIGGRSDGVQTNLRIRQNSIVIGRTTTSSAQESIQIGHNAGATGTYGIALGSNAQTSSTGIALGAYSSNSTAGTVEIGSTQTPYGYLNTNYRKITGVYPGENEHDAATVAQGNTLATTAPTTATAGVLGQLYTDTTNMHTYQCTAIDTTDPNNPSYTWTQRW